VDHEKVARFPFAFVFGYCINFCISAMLRTRVTFSWPILCIYIIIIFYYRFQVTTTNELSSWHQNIRKTSARKFRTTLKAMKHML